MGKRKERITWVGAILFGLYMAGAGYYGSELHEQQGFWRAMRLAFVWPYWAMIQLAEDFAEEQDTPSTTDRSNPLGGGCAPLWTPRPSSLLPAACPYLWDRVVSVCPLPGFSPSDQSDAQCSALTQQIAVRSRPVTFRYHAGSPGAGTLVLSSRRNHLDPITPRGDRSGDAALPRYSANAAMALGMIRGEGIFCLEARNG